MSVFCDPTNALLRKSPIALSVGQQSVAGAGESDLRVVDLDSALRQVRTIIQGTGHQILDGLHRLDFRESEWDR